MLRIRLSRTGRKNQPSYRIVVADQKAARDGAHVDRIGHYNPTTDPTTLQIDSTKAEKWLSQGAQPSERVSKLFKKEGIIK
tara:strand:+ start:768 stop:1010 length:243 start_codon:yes stop_codon:yes gene_type:complete